MLLHHRADWRSGAALVDQVAHLHLLVPRALFLDLLNAPLQGLLALLCGFELGSQRLLGCAGLALAGLELADAVAEEVVDELHLGDTGLERRVLRGERVVRERRFEVRAVHRRGRAGRRLAGDAEAVHGGLKDDIAVQRLLEHVLGRDVGGVGEVGRAGARDGRLRAVGEAGRDLARCAAVLSEPKLAVGVGVGGSEAVDSLALVSQRVRTQDADVLTFLRPGPPALTRLRLLMTSVLSEIGRGRPCSFKNSPQALHSTAPDSSRRQSGVVLVVQFWQTGWVHVSDRRHNRAVTSDDAVLSIATIRIRARFLAGSGTLCDTQHTGRNVPASCPVRQQ
jgi:hypothetical protein